MAGDPLQHAGGQRDGAGLAALRRGEDELSVDDAQLSADGHQHGDRVDVVGGESEDLALSEATAGAERRDELELPGQGAMNSVEALAGPDDDVGGRGRRPLDRACFARVLGDQPVFYCRVED
jgi:hypothetical protein